MVFHRHSSHTHTFVSFLSVFLFLFFFFLLPQAASCTQPPPPPKNLTHPLVFKCSMQHQQRSGETRQQQNSPFLFFFFTRRRWGRKIFCFEGEIIHPIKVPPVSDICFRCVGGYNSAPPRLLHPHLLAHGAVNCESSGSSEGSPSEFRHLIYTYSILLLTQAVPHHSPPSIPSFPVFLPQPQRD